MVDVTTDPNWPVGLLASAYWPHHDPQKLTMAICVGYFEADQPGGDPTTITVAGFVAAKARWRYFDERWPRVLRHEGLMAFNGHDFMRGTGEFGAGWIDNRPRQGWSHSDAGAVGRPARASRMFLFAAFRRLRGRQRGIPIRRDRRRPIRRLRRGRDRPSSSVDGRAPSGRSDAVRLRRGRS